MTITSKEYRCLKGAERIVRKRDVTPEDAKKAAGLLMAYARMIEARRNQNPNEHQMDISELIMKGIDYERRENKI